MFPRIRRYLGPSVIVAASVVGTGELIVAPSLGAKVGLAALWIVLLGCLVKVFLQEQLGRHTILTGETTLEAFNRMPGPKWRLSWVGWCWLLLLISTSFQQAGILATIVQSLKLLHVAGDPRVLAVFIASLTTGILMVGRYSTIERTSGLLVALFTLMTIVAVVLLQRTDQAISMGQIVEGLKFSMPTAGIAAAVAVFGITGIGTSELLFYPYWCLEKGYARDLRDGSRTPELLKERITGMRVDISVALVVYTFATIAFFLLGATILYASGREPKGLEMIGTLSAMYTQTFGEWVFYLFAAGAFVVLYSTFFVGLAAFSRILTDTLRLLSAKKDFDARCVLPRCVMGLALIYVLLSLLFRTTPHWLIIYGGAVQTILLPIFGIAILWLGRSRGQDYGARWLRVAAWISLAIILMAALISLRRLF